MNSKSNLLFRILVGLIILSAITHLLQSRLGFHLHQPMMTVLLFSLYTIVFIVYSLIAFHLGKIRKSYHQQSGFGSKEIKRFKQIGLLLLFLIPFKGIIEIVINSNSLNLSPVEALFCFLGSVFNSPSLLVASLIVFILIEYLPVAEKNRTDLGEII